MSPGSLCRCRSPLHPPQSNANGKGPACGPGLSMLGRNAGRASPRLISLKLRPAENANHELQSNVVSVEIHDLDEMGVGSPHTQTRGPEGSGPRTRRVGLPVVTWAVHVVIFLFHLTSYRPTASLADRGPAWPDSRVPFALNTAIRSLSVVAYTGLAASSDAEATESTSAARRIEFFMFIPFCRIGEALWSLYFRSSTTSENSGRVCRTADIKRS